MGRRRFLSIGTFILGIRFFYSLSKMGNLPLFAVSCGWTCFSLWTTKFRHGGTTALLAKNGCRVHWSLMALILNSRVRNSESALNGVRWPLGGARTVFRVS